MDDRLVPVRSASSADVRPAISNSAMLNRYSTMRRSAGEKVMRDTRASSEFGASACVGASVTGLSFRGVLVVCRVCG